VVGTKGGNINKLDYLNLNVNCSQLGCEVNWLTKVKRCVLDGNETSLTCHRSFTSRVTGVTYHRSQRKAAK